MQTDPYTHKLQRSDPALPGTAHRRDARGILSRSASSREERQGGQRIYFRGLRELPHRHELVRSVRDR